MTSSSDASVRILVAGSVNGHLATLFQKVSLINSKHGPFSALFCVGNFLNIDDIRESRDDSSADMVTIVGGGTRRVAGCVGDESCQYLTGEKPLPMPTYVIPGEDVESPLIYSRCLLEDGGVLNEASSASGTQHAPPGHRLTVLGSGGVVMVRGMSVAYLRGRRRDGLYGAKDVSALVEKARELSPIGSIDLLLTADWPLGVCKNVDMLLSSPGVPPSPLPSAGIPSSILSLEFTPAPVGCTHAASAAKLLSPRYHFSSLNSLPSLPTSASSTPCDLAASLSIFYQRPPYTTIARCTTRFIGLGTCRGPAVADKKDEKYLHALNLTPCLLMSRADLMAPPINTTPSPYEDAPLLIPGMASITGRPPPPTYPPPPRLAGGAAPLLPFPPIDPAGPPHKRLRQDNNSNQLRVQKAPAEPLSCWFCLGAPQVEKHLIFSIYNHLYAALPKGALSLGALPPHILIIPILHSSSFLRCYEPSVHSDNVDLQNELQQYKTAFVNYFRKKHDHGCVIYERYINDDFNINSNSGSGNVNTKQHCHMQVIPLPPSTPVSLVTALVQSGGVAGLTFEILYSPSSSPPCLATIQQQAAARVAGDHSYHYVEIYDNNSSSPTILLNKIQKSQKFRFNFVREVVVKVLNCVDRESWKTCLLTKEEEKDVCGRVKSDFKDFDPSL